VAGELLNGCLEAEPGFFFLGREASARISLSLSLSLMGVLPRINYAAASTRRQWGKKEQSGDYLGRAIPETGNFHLRDLAFELKDLWD
jgi:hypothetical protein